MAKQVYLFQFDTYEGVEQFEKILDQQQILISEHSLLTVESKSGFIFAEWVIAIRCSKVTYALLKWAYIARPHNHFPIYRFAVEEN